MAFLHLVGSGVLVYAVDVNGDDAVFHEDVRLVPLSGGLLAGREALHLKSPSLIAGRVHVLYDREEGTFLSRALLVLDKVGASQQYEQSGPPGLQITLDPVREGVL